MQALWMKANAADGMHVMRAGNIKICFVGEYATAFQDCETLKVFATKDLPAHQADRWREVLTNHSDVEFVTWEFVQDCLNYRRPTSKLL
jgi:hypothetical protein